MMLVRWEKGVRTGVVEGCLTGVEEVVWVSM